MKTIGIMGALPEEIATLQKTLQNQRTEQLAGVEYYICTHAGLTLVLCCSGMGKANAASTAQVLITRFGVDAILFSGIAGNMSGEVSVGDVAVGSDVVYHDAEDRMLAQSAPFTSVYTPHPVLTNALEAGCKHAGARYIIGRIATGDQFISDATIKKQIQQKCHPACVEMEGAAVGQIAMRNGVPFGIIRVMSDDANESFEALNLRQFDVNEYIDTVSSIVISALNELSGQQL